MGPVLGCGERAHREGVGGSAHHTARAHPAGKAAAGSDGAMPLLRGPSLGETVGFGFFFFLDK